MKLFHAVGRRCDKCGATVMGGSHVWVDGLMKYLCGPCAKKVKAN